MWEYLVVERGPKRNFIKEIMENEEKGWELLPESLNLKGLSGLVVMMRKPRTE